MLTGLLNFFGYGAPISSTFIVILLPTIMSIFSICAIVALLYKFCEKGELKELVTSMALPAIVMLLFLRWPYEKENNFVFNIDFQCVYYDFFFDRLQLQHWQSRCNSCKFCARNNALWNIKNFCYKVSWQDIHNHL